MSKVFAWITGAVLCTLHFSTWATTPDDERPIIKAAITPAQDYSDEFVRQRSAVTALGPSLFGDNTGLSTGVTEFATTDVEVPGNTALPVRIARRYRVDYRTAPNTGKAAGLFNDWDLDIPHLHGTLLPRRETLRRDGRCRRRGNPTSAVRWTPITRYRRYRLP